jgi:hypothetical protein
MSQSDVDLLRSGWDAVEAVFVRRRPQPPRFTG